MARIPLADAELDLEPGFYAEEAADELLVALLRDVPWQTDEVVLFGRSHPIPRLHRWFGDPGLSYRWSGLTLEPHPWLPALLGVCTAVERATGERFNTVLVNLYRDGRDCMGFHADDERELGPRPVIASVSLGATRDFVLRHRTTGARTVLPLTHGSLLVMGGDTQSSYTHGLPRRLRVRDPRINMTFRRIVE